MRSQCLGALAGDSHSAAPAMKSATTASMATPAPLMRMPVCPVARKVAAWPAASNARVSASAVYFLPSAQSVPTVSSRLPLRRTPVPTGKRSSLCRTSCSVRPQRAAVSRIASTEPSRVCMPLTMSSPASIASQIGAIHCGEILPPTGAMPISNERAPCATASAGVRRGKPMSTVPPGRLHCATQASGRHCRTPNAVLAFESLRSSPRKRRYGSRMPLMAARPSACAAPCPVVCPSAGRRPPPIRLSS